MRNVRRGLALLLCVGLALTLVVSSAYLVHEAGHDCVGEDCPICAAVSLAAQLLRTVLTLLIALLGLFGMLAGGKRLAGLFSGRRLPAARTLVGWKIRLDD